MPGPTTPFIFVPIKKKLTLVSFFFMIEENLAKLEAKSNKLGQLLDVRGLKISELKDELKALRKTGLAELAAEKKLAQKLALLELNLQKKIHKKEIKLEVDAVKLEIKAQVALTKEVEKDESICP
jgi:hypothetical protein